MQQSWSYDIREPVAFVARIADRSRRNLGYHERERLIQFLLIALWRLSLDYKPGPLSFSVVAYRHLPRRIIDWQRLPEEGGRTKWQFREHTYERTLPGLASLDDPRNDQLDAALARSGLDSDASSFADDMRVLKARGRRPGRRDQWLGDEAA